MDGVSLPPASFTCPRCGMTSYNPNDIREGYCGNCHDWTSPDWTVQADGYRLVIEDGAMTGLAYDEFPWLWGDPRYNDATVYSWMADGPFPDSAVLTPGALAAQPVADPPPGLPYRSFGMCDE